MAYIFKKKEEVVEYLTQLEFTIGEDYNHYIVPHHSYTTRFDIFYNSENVGYVENEELTPNANSEWVIHIPTDKRAYLESKNKGLVGAIFDLPTNQDGTIDKKYYIEPVAFTRIIGKDYKNTSHQIDAKGPGSYVGLKFDNEFWNVEDTEVASGSKQLNISIDLKKFANVFKYSLAEVSGVMPSGVVTDPQGISVRTCDTYPSIIIAESSNTRPVWKDLKDITVGYAANATNADMFGFKKPEDFVTYTNINSDITSYFDNSYNYGFRTGYDVEKNESYVYTRAYRVHLVGDISGEAEVSNFNDIDIECTLADKYKKPGFKVEKLDVTEDEDKVIFNIPKDNIYDFRINNTSVVSFVEPEGNDIAELFDADPDCIYNDGDLVGICIDGLVRPLINNTELKPVEYVGVVSLNPAAILGGIIGKTSKIPVAICGRKYCWVKGSGNLVGRRVVVDYATGEFKLWDKLFNSEYNGIVLSEEEANKDRTLCYILLK